MFFSFPGTRDKIIMGLGSGQKIINFFFVENLVFACQSTHVSRVMKLDTESPIDLERIRGEPPLKVEGASQELQKDVVNRFR